MANLLKIFSVLLFTLLVNKGNSQTYKVFVVDASNNLICFSLVDGKKIWSYTTDKSFVNSFKIRTIS